MLEKVRGWLIHLLGGYTGKETQRLLSYYVSRNITLNDRAALFSRQYEFWKARAVKAEERVAKLEDRLSRAVHLKTEERETMERLYISQAPMQEVEEWIKGRMARAMADTILNQVGLSCMRDVIRMEYVWSCEAYLLPKEE